MERHIRLRQVERGLELEVVGCYSNSISIHIVYIVTTRCFLNKNVISFFSYYFWVRQGNPVCPETEHIAKNGLGTCGILLSQPLKIHTVTKATYKGKCLFGLVVLEGLSP